MERFLIFDVRAPFTEQYQRLVPNAGTFGYTLYQISPLLMAVVYSFFNSLALALFAVFALAIQMIVKFKNQYWVEQKASLHFKRYWIYTSDFYLAHTY